MKDRAARGFVDPARLHPDKPVFDHVDPADPVFPAKFVQLLHHREGSEFLPVHGDADPAVEFEGDDLRLVRRFLRGNREFEHPSVRRREGIEPRVLHDAGLVADMQQVPVHRVRLLGACFDRDLLGGAVGDHLGAPGELRPKPLVPPRRNHLEIRRQCRCRQFETHLIIPLPGRTVRHRVGLLLLRDLNHPLRNQRPGNARPEVILPLVNRTRLHHRENKVARKFLREIVDIDFRGAGRARLLFEPTQFLLLPDVRTKGDHLGPVRFRDPRQQHRGVQTTGIGKNDLHKRAVKLHAQPPLVMRIVASAFGKSELMVMVPPQSSNATIAL